MAEWIAPGDWRLDAWPVFPRPALFVKNVDLPFQPTACRLKITASWKYTLRINGVSVNSGPARCYPARQLVDTLDVASLLRSGPNRLEVFVIGCTGITAYQPLHRSGLFVDGVATDGRQTVSLSTPDSWQFHRDCGITSRGLMLALPVGPQEHHTLPQIFSPPEETRPLGPEGSPPWWSMEDRPIPLLREHLLHAKIAMTGHAIMPQDSAENRAHAFRNLSDADFHVDPAPTPPSPHTSDITLEKDHWITLDFHRTQTIRPALAALSATAGTVLDLYYGIEPGPRPIISLGFGDTREGFHDSLTFTHDVHNAAWETLLPRGFQFLTIHVSAGRATFTPQCRAVEYPFEALRPAPFDDLLLQKIWHTSADTLHSGTNDVIVDTCHRENVCWTFDACVAGKAAWYTFGETRMWRRCLSLIAQGIDERGVPYSVVPHGPTCWVLVDQALLFVINCNEYVQLTGDKTLWGEIAPALGRFWKFLLSGLTRDQLYVPPAWSWHWIDWSPIDRRAYSFPINAMLLLACDSFRAAGINDDVAEVAVGLRDALGHFWDEKEKAFANHREPAEPILIQSTFDPAPMTPIPFGPHANALAIHARVGTPQQQNAAAHFLARSLAQPYGPVNQLGSGWVDLIFSSLIPHGLADAGIDFVRRRYGDDLKNRATAWGEYFPLHGKNNTAHSWGAAVNSFLALAAAPRV